MADYRTNEHVDCVGCRERDAKLSAYQTEHKHIRRHQFFYNNPTCISCANTLRNKEEKNTFTKASNEDGLYCEGGTFRRCPRVPHVHRHCPACGARWLERTAEQENLINDSEPK